MELADRAPPDLAKLLPEVVTGLCEMRLVRSPSVVRFARLRRIDHAYVVFTHDYFEAIGALVPFLEAQHILSAGRYGGWNYSSMEDALGFGREAANRALALT